MELFFVLLVLLVTTRTFGELAERVGQPALVGELISGILLGVIVANYAEHVPTLANLQHSKVFGAITDLGMFFIMLYAGIEMQPNKMLKYSRGSLFVALGGMLLPLALGLGLGVTFLPESNMRVAQALFIGTVLAITAVPATVRILIDLGMLNSRSGQVIVSAAVFDDVLSILLLACLTALMGTDGPLSVAAVLLLLAKATLFFAVTIVIGYYAFPWGGRLLKHVKEKELDFSALLIVALAFSVLAEWLALHFILGAFVAGVFFGRKTIDATTYEGVKNKMSGMTFGFLAPVFFASIGLHLHMSALLEIPVFITFLVLFAFAGKLLGAGIAAYGVGLTATESVAVGIGMSARGAVELVIADIALRSGLLTSPDGGSPLLQNLFSAVVFMAVATTLATPIILRRVYSRGGAGFRAA